MDTRPFGQQRRKKKRNPLNNSLNNGSPILESQWIFFPTGRIKTLVDPLYTFNFLFTGNASFSTTAHALRGFTPYRVDVDDGLRAHGGVTTLVQDSLHSVEIPVQTDLQTVCVKVYLPSLSLTVCNIYISPRQTVMTF